MKGVEAVRQDCLVVRSSLEGHIPRCKPKSSSHTISSGGGGMSSSIISAAANIAFLMGVGGPSCSPTH